MKNHPVSANSDRQMDRMQLIAAFHNFANALKNSSFCKIIGTRQNIDLG